MTSSIKRVSLLAASAAVLAVAGAETAEEIAKKYADRGFYLAFQEEFSEGFVREDGKVVPNPDVWCYEEGMVRNHEDQCYTKDNAIVEDGCLVIEARNEQTKNPRYNKYGSNWYNKKRYADYSSASIQTIHNGNEGYCWGPGIYEVRAKIPVGEGYWSAIWTLGTKYEWPYNGEIDIMEYYRDAIHADVAWGGWNRWQAVWNSRAPRMSEFEDDFADKFHVWKMVWDEDYIRLYLDDRCLNETNLDRTVNPRTDWNQYDNVNPYRGDHKQYILLNLALGGDNGGDPAKAAYPARYYVDYVRVYQPDNAGVEDVAATSPQEHVEGYYNLQGMYMGNDADTLANGLYVVKTNLGARKMAFNR